ncbi:hypothetical protein ACFW9D_07975 [Streptomyces sp. NPDC059524]|uniref:hypothetical protein n=1 Tax=Streptomyces sp. NPDC059524 TaxID=3346856 RepID=UPI0036AF195C
MLRQVKSLTFVVIPLSLAVSVLAGCSGGGGDSQREAGAGGRACKNYLSEKNSTRLGKPRDPYYKPVAPAQLRKALRKEIEGWTPGSPPISLDEYIVCDVSDESTHLFTVEWSKDSMKRIKSKERWEEPVGDAYFAKSGSVGGSAALAFPCQIPGAADGQEDALPLEVGVGGVPRSVDSPGFQRSLALDLARSVRKIMQCENNPVIPEKPGS